MLSASDETKLLKKLKTQDHLFDSIASLVIPSKTQREREREGGRERGRERKGREGGREGEREIITFNISLLQILI